MSKKQVDRVAKLASLAGASDPSVWLLAQIAGSTVKLEEMAAAHYAYQDEMARQQVALLAEIRDAVTR